MAGWALCMTLVLAALAGVVCETRYQKFRRQHMDYPRTHVQPEYRYCDSMIQQRQVIAQGDPCKLRNTFVNEPDQDVVDACYQTPDAAGRYTTPRRLDITACYLLRGTTWPNCVYQAWQVQNYVVVNCINGLPVHLNSTHP